MRQLSDFAGLWQFSREIEDLAGGQRLFVQGICRFVKGTEGLMLLEEGMLTIPGQPPLKAERRYLWREAVGEIAVSFEDGRPFHQFDPTEPQPQASHDCVPDRYEACYDFAKWPIWTVTWRVCGPRKDFVSHTRFERLDEDG